MPSGRMPTGGGFHSGLPAAACAAARSSRQDRTQATAAGRERGWLTNQAGSQSVSQAGRAAADQETPILASRIPAPQHVAIPTTRQPTAHPRPACNGKPICCCPPSQLAAAVAANGRERCPPPANRFHMPHRCHRRQPPGCGRGLPHRQTAAVQVPASAAAAPLPSNRVVRGWGA